jgi:hypothetical protein
MKMLYLSCHSILEFDEVRLFKKLGIDVFSMGSYINPNTPHDPKRPALSGKPNEHLLAVALQCSKENLHPELIEWADVILIMHKPEWVTLNWFLAKNKRVIWRSIGQSVPSVESSLAVFRSQGMEIVRYSPEEKNIRGYVGENAVIRFYKDKDEFCKWNGVVPKVITVCQEMRNRGLYCGYELFMRATEGYPRVIYGPNNENTGVGGGTLSYTGLKQAYKNHRVYFYTGTYPASYTLNFMEAMMTGIPIVAIGDQLADINVIPGAQTYEVHKIIKNGVNGFCSNSINELRGAIGMLMENEDLARRIGEAGRNTAIELFGESVISKQWKEYLL